ncbi:MAG: bacteriohemerythrin [Nitrospirota bacterium]
MEDSGIDLETEKILNELNLGIGELDDQHQAFFMHMVGLRRALIEGSGGRDKLMKTLRYLDTFIDEHFRAEEGYMRRHNYPGILVHRAEHEAFAKTIAEFKKTAMDLESRGEVLSFLAVDVEHRLEKWLTEHILVHDRKMADYLSERG